LIRSAHQLIASGFNIEVLIAGEGPDRSRLKALIDGLDLTDRVRLLGYRSDTIALFEAMDVFALSSLREGLPNVLLEAMALEVPVVATSVAGVPRLIENDKNGLLTEPGNRESLSNALMKLSVDECLRHRLRKEGRESVKSGYCFSARMQKIRAIYDRLVT
jgi:glycosyltransferase involved in cell wall biosynthesis